MKDLIPALTRDKICWLPITYYRSPLRLLMTWRPFSAQHNYHGVSNVESGIPPAASPDARYSNPQPSALWRWPPAGLPCPLHCAAPRQQYNRLPATTPALSGAPVRSTAVAAAPCGCTCGMMKWFTSKRIIPATTATATTRSAPACAGALFVGASIIRIALTIP